MASISDEEPVVRPVAAGFPAGARHPGGQQGASAPGPAPLAFGPRVVVVTCGGLPRCFGEVYAQLLFALTQAEESIRARALGPEAPRRTSARAVGLAVLRCEASTHVAPRDGGDALSRRLLHAELAGERSAPGRVRCWVAAAAFWDPVPEAQPPAVAASRGHWGAFAEQLLAANARVATGTRTRREVVVEALLAEWASEHGARRPLLRWHTSPLGAALLVRGVLVQGALGLRAPGRGQCAAAQLLTSRKCEAIMAPPHRALHRFQEALAGQPDLAVELPEQAAPADGGIRVRVRARHRIWRGASLRAFRTRFEVDFSSTPFWQALGCETCGAWPRRTTTRQLQPWVPMPWHCGSSSSAAASGGPAPGSCEGAA